MPIKPENKHLYPKDWKNISRRIRFDRACGRCEFCGVEHKATGWRDERGTFTKFDYEAVASGEQEVPCDAKDIRIILTCAHLDHDPTNNCDENLKALCQKCHLEYDREHHKANASKTREEKRFKKGQKRMF